MKVTLSAPYCPSCGYPFDDPKRIIQPQGHSVNPCCETCGREEAPAKATGIMSEFFKAKCSRCGAALDKSGPLCDTCLEYQRKNCNPGGYRPDLGGLPHECRGRINLIGKVVDGQAIGWAIEGGLDLQHGTLGGWSKEELENIAQVATALQKEAVIAERERCACLVLKYGPLSLRELAEKIMEGK